jgi:DNA repair exonuclease SbcCD nuclease subunit
MSQVYIIGDTHFGKSAAHNLKKWMDIQFSYFYDQFIPYLRENVKKGDILVHGGDLFDDRTHTPIIILNKVDQLLQDLAKILPVHIIIGNHDMYNKVDTSVNTPKIFRHIPNVNIYEKTTTLEVHGKKLVLMPWVEYKKDMINEIKNNPGDYLFCHSDLNGCRMHLSSIAHRNKDKINVEEFSSYKHVFASHIHIRQVQENFEFIGAPYQMDRNDYNDKKGLTILDLETGKTKFIENIVSPTFKRFKVEKDGDLLLLEHLNTKKHFVDLEINNSVLVGKRKNRKILEEQLGKKNFASVEYLNDLVKNKKEDLPKLKEIELGEFKSDDFSEILTDYTESQEYENDTIKQGVLNELNNILTIYNKEYKFKSDGL